MEFFVPGTPAPGGSKKGFYNKNLGRVIMVPDCKRTKPWMTLVSQTVAAAYDGQPMSGPIKLSMQFMILRPKFHYGSGKNACQIKPSLARSWPTVKPDLTKLERSTEDALTGILWRDDCQVCKKETVKYYVTRNPGVIITIELI
jgi:Holliday junction resolvase RusA-like endonuclease